MPLETKIEICYVTVFFQQKLNKLNQISGLICLNLDNRLLARQFLGFNYGKNGAN